MLLYLRTWLIIKRKQFLNLFPAKNHSFAKFAIVCSPRSGSTWLHTLLNSHTGIYSYGEILREEHERNPTKPIPTIEKLVFKPHHLTIKAVGLKIFYDYNLDNIFKKSFNEIVNDQSVRIIHLIRQDKKAQFESLSRAQSSNIWSSGKPAKSNLPIEVNSVELNLFQNNLSQQQEEMMGQLNQHQVFTISYEELRDQTDKTCIAIQNYLSIPPRTLFSLLKRQSR